MAVKRKKTVKGKKKYKYTILAPPEFNNAMLGTTLATEPEKVLGRTVLVSMKDLTGKLNMQKKFVKFMVSEVKGNTAYTIPYEHHLDKTYLKRLTRPRRSKVEVVQDLKTKDNVLVRMKTNIFTVRRISTEQKTALIKETERILKQEALKKTYNTWAQDVVYGAASNAVFKNCKKIVPIRRAEVRAMELKTKPEFKVEAAGVEEQVPSA